METDDWMTSLIYMFNSDRDSLAKNCYDDLGHCFAANRCVHVTPKNPNSLALSDFTKKYYYKCMD